LRDMARPAEHGSGYSTGMQARDFRADGASAAWVKAGVRHSPQEAIGSNGF
jgi:hypothetical protein